MNHRSYLLVPIAASILALAACDNHKPTTASSTPGEKLDSAIATTEQKTEQWKNEAKVQSAEAKKETSEAISDATITARINTQLAADPSLSAIHIDVDSKNGHVRLSGTAPDSTSRDRATVLASAVNGVQSVDNLLKVDKKS
jgi:hyperosmotically inducible protein